MYDGLYDAVAVVVNEAQRAALVGNGQRKLVVVHQANLHSTHTYTQHHVNIDFVYFVLRINRCLQCFDAVGWAAGRASGL